MGKKRRKGKPRTTPPGEAGGVADAILSIRAKLAEGRSMAALRDAKQLVKTKPSDEARAVLADAYAARIEDLAGNGRCNEARDLLAAARERLPDAARWAHANEAIAFRAGDLREPLRAWREAAPESDARARLSEELRRRLVDPRDLLRAGVLPADDPLAVAAQAVVAALEEATAGALTRETREGLRVVGRRSPLVPWRSFALAVAAFHAGDDAAARHALEGIPDDVPLARLARVLRQQLGDASHDAAPEKPSPAATRLRIAVGGNAARCIEAVHALRHVLDDPDSDLDELQGLLTKTLKLLRGEDARLAFRFSRWMLAEAQHTEPLSWFVEEAFDIVDAAWPHDESARIRAGEKMVHPIQRFLDAASLLLDAHGELRALPAAQLAFLLDFLAPMAEPIWKSVAPFCLEASVGTTPFLDPEDAMRLEQMRQRFRNDGEISLLVTCLQSQMIVLDGLALRTGVRSTGTTAELRLREYACVLEPTTARYRAWFETLATHKGSARRRAAILEQWAAHDPRDVEPRLQQVTHALAASSYNKALRLVEQAEAIDPLHEDVRAARFHVLMVNLREHFSRGVHSKLRGDLDALDATPAAAAPERRCYLAAARVAAARKLNDAPALDAAVRELERLAGSRRAATAIEVIVSGDLMAHGGRREISGNPAAAVAEAVRLRQLGRKCGVDMKLSFDAETLAEIKLVHLPDAAEDLLELADVLHRNGARDELHLVAGKGLANDGPWLQRFLLYRCRAMEGIFGTSIQDRAKCLAAARHLARQRRDDEVLRAPELEDLERWLDDPEEVDDETVRQVVASERRLICRLRGRLAKRSAEFMAPKKRKPKPPPQRHAKPRPKHQQLELFGELGSPAGPESNNATQGTTS